MSYRKLEQRNGVHFEASSTSRDIPLTDMSNSEPTDGSQPHDPLLASFEDSEEEDTPGKTSDERLREGGAEGITRTMHDTVSSSNNAVAGETAAAITETPARIKVNINMISNGFNFLDRMFKGTQGRPQSGAGNDGVFSNMSAKPDTQPRVDGDKPPTYEEAAADSTPPYWENSILSPGFEDEVFVDGLPVGNLVNFAWNLMVSASFQFVGFLLTYVLHTSHAAKQGSRAGLGITFAVYAYSMFPSDSKRHLGNENLASERVEVSNPTEYDVSGSEQITGPLDDFHSTLSTGTDMSAEETSSIKVLVASGVVATLGLYILLKAFRDYHRARKMEEVILAPAPDTMVPAQVEEMV